MSLYNMLFGRNPQTGILLATIGFKENDIERFRDVCAEDDGKTIAVYTRTGGNNRADYPQVALYRSPLFRTTEDDDFDNTYATFYFDTPPEFVADVNGLSDILANGLRKEFCEHFSKTLRREPTESDKLTAAYEAERAELARTEHFMANGHTFVPKDDWAMKVALTLAEKNGGKLLSCWGIMPLAIVVEQGKAPYPGAKGPEAKYLRRVEVQYDYGWGIDRPYWDHCRELFAAEFPITMVKIAGDVAPYLAKQAARA